MLLRAVRYVAEGESLMQAHCHCRECRHITGGSPNMFVAMPIDKQPFHHVPDGMPAFERRRSDRESWLRRLPGRTPPLLAPEKAFELGQRELVRLVGPVPARTQPERPRRRLLVESYGCTATT
ncbi:MAG: hypothetical protein JO228_14060 [Xanthobacteraceae bacterium]|nr:hypothetical protein [Xanthobacteraceae bacterium]